MTLKKLAVLGLILMTLSACTTAPSTRGDESKSNNLSSETQKEKEPEEKEDQEDIQDDGYNIVEVTTEYGEDTYYWAVNTDAKTLGEALEDAGDGLFQLKGSGKDRIVYSYRGQKNKGSEKWIFIQNDCEDGSKTCLVENVDEIELNKDLSFISFYGDESKLSFD